MLEFGPWAPDSADLNASFVRECRNVLPGNGFYLPANMLSELSSALGSKCVGGYMAKSTSGGYIIFAGTADKLYRSNSGSSFTDVTRTSGGGYNVADGEYWEFAQFGDRLIAVNLVDVPQYIGITLGTNFAALGGSPPPARHVGTVGPHVILTGITSAPNTVKWSALEDSDNWTPGSFGSDEQEFPDGGQCGRISGTETGLVLQKEAVRQMVFQPSSSLSFTFEKVEALRGSFAPYSSVTVGSVMFYYGLDGFYAASGGTSEPIGQGFVNDWFRERVNQSKITSMVGLADPRAPRVLWLFNSGSSAPFDTILGLDWSRSPRRWFYTEQPLEFVFGAATLGFTLDDLGGLGYIDNLTVSFDAPQFVGGLPNLAGFNTSHKLGFFDGATLEALLETSEVQLTPGRRSFVNGITPIIDSAQVGISLGIRENFQEALTYGTEGVLETTGKVSIEASGRYMRAKARVPAGAQWSRAQGLDADFQDDGDA
jgi:hypothetical protein